MLPFIEAICKSTLVPACVKVLPEAKLKKLQSLCQSLRQIYNILNSVARIVPAYAHKELYVLKRLDAMSVNETNYKEQGFMSTYFEGKTWEQGQLPSDPEIVASVFCALLDYSSKNRRHHFYDLNLTHGYIVKEFDNKDVSLVNRQPQQHFRAHFEVIIGKKEIVCPSVSS